MSQAKINLFYVSNTNVNEYGSNSLLREQVVDVSQVLAVVLNNRASKPSSGKLRGSSEVVRSIPCCMIKELPIQT